MTLHLDIDSFKVLLTNVKERTGYRLDVLEKDYYVVLLLKELAEKQKDGLPAYFKGGTALYKALKAINRFSEDIDLSVDTRGCSRTQNDRRLERATKKYSSLVRNAEEGRTNRSEVLTTYEYSPIVPYDKDDVLQRFGKLRVEATSFTIGEPTGSLSIAPLVYELATNDEKRILEDKYDVSPFEIMTITLERIFVDKLFAAEAYSRRADENKHAFDAAKHIYDLAVMADLPQIVQLCGDVSHLRYLLSIRLQEELERRDGIPNVTPDMFTFFSNIKNNSLIRKAYDTMQQQYVLRSVDKIPFEDALGSIERIKTRLDQNIAWTFACDCISDFHEAQEAEAEFDEDERE